MTRDLYIKNLILNTFNLFFNNFNKIKFNIYKNIIKLIYRYLYF